MSLAPREREILDARIAGLTPKQIARALGISIRTVYNTSDKTRRDAEARTAEELVAKYFRGEL